MALRKLSTMAMTSWSSLGCSVMTTAGGGNGGVVGAGTAPDSGC